MLEQLQIIAQNQDAPLLAALALGLLTAIAPCPLATNISATAFIAKTINNKYKVILSGVFYTIGRLVSYTLLAGAIYTGLGKFQIAKIFQTYGERLLGPILLILGLIMLDVIKLNFVKSMGITDRISERFKNQGLLGSFFLGALFALAFCPYSGALFFGMLIPMTLSKGLLTPIVFSIGTGIPVLFFSFIIAFSISKLGVYYNAITKTEKWMRKIAAVVFIVTGLYYISIFII